MKNYLQFWDRCIVDQECYFSYVGFNSLFKENLQTREVKHVGFFVKEEISRKMLHRKVFFVEGSLFFIPFQGKGIYEYNIKENCFINYAIQSRNEIVSYSNAFLEEKKIYLVPANDDVDFAIFDCEKKCINYYKEFWPCIKEINTGIKFFDICSSVLKNGEVIITVYGTGDILIINWNNKSIECHNLGDNYKFSNIVFQNNSYWFLPTEGNLIVSCNEKFKNIKEYFCKDLDVEEKPFISLLSIGAEKVLVPANSNYIWHLQPQEVYFEKMDIRFPLDFWDKDSKGIKFLGYEVWEEQNIILYPKSSKYMCEFSPMLNRVDFRKVKYDGLKELQSKVEISVLEKNLQNSDFLLEDSSDINTLSNFITFICDFASDVKEECSEPTI